MPGLEQTLVIVKPDAVQRGLIGEIITRFEKAGLQISAAKMVWPAEEHFHKHYEGIGKLISRRGEDVYNVTLAAMTESPVFAVIFEGVDAIEHVRKMVGATDPREAAPGTIRGDFTHITRAYAIANGMTLPNLIHASANAEEAALEIPLWFASAEIHSYELPANTVVRGRIPQNKD